MKYIIFVLLISSQLSCSNGFPFEISTPQKPSTGSTSNNEPFPIKAEGVQFFKDISYGDHVRNKFDLFLPKSKDPTGIVIFIHGGGFVGGDKNFAYSTNEFKNLINALLIKNVAFATINYQFLEDNESIGVLKCLNDSKKAIQYIRHHAADYNLKKSDVVLIGGSAGAGTSLWIALNDDMASKSSKSNVEKESTRVKGVVAIQTQGSYDVLNWDNLIFKEYKSQGFTYKSLLPNKVVKQFYGVESMEQLNTPSIKMTRERLDFHDLLTSDDPEIYLQNTAIANKIPTNNNALLHHPLHSKVLMDKANSENVRSKVYLPTMNIDTRNGESMVDFVLRKLKE